VRINRFLGEFIQKNPPDFGVSAQAS